MADRLMMSGSAYAAAPARLQNLIARSTRPACE
jgi:hypothetical protein